MRVRREHYLIDGYNVIHAWPELSALTDELSEARDRLIGIMTEYGAYESFDVTIVFDALFTNDAFHEERTAKYVSVVYTAPGETADSYIERTAYELAKNGREVHVVTGDSAEQIVALGAGAYRLPPRELRRRVKKFKEKIRRDYLEAPHIPIMRSELSARIDINTAKKLEALRRGT